MFCFVSDQGLVNVWYGGMIFLDSLIPLTVFVVYVFCIPIAITPIRTRIVIPTLVGKFDLKGFDNRIYINKM